MGKTIQQSQTELLATKFLDFLGEGKDGSDLILTETTKGLYRIAAILIKEVYNNLEKGGNISGAALASSFKPLNPRRVGSSVVLDIEALYYYQFLNRGVKGTKKGNGEYSFKTPYPSKKMVAAIRQWLAESGRATTSRSVKKPISSLEVKRKSLSQMNVKPKSIAEMDAAYAIARSIKQNGIKKTGFFDKAFDTTNKIANQELGKALKIDIINSLPSTLDGE